MSANRRSWAFDSTGSTVTTTAMPWSRLDTGRWPILIHHIALATEWEAAVAAGEYRRSTLERSLEQEGFIHCSTPGQWRATLERHYSGVAAPLLLFTIDPALVPSEIRIEGGFPHIYGPLPVDAVVSRRTDPLTATDRVRAWWNHTPGRPCSTSRWTSCRLGPGRFGMQPPAPGSRIRRRCSSRSRCCVATSAGTARSPSHRPGSSRRT